MTEWLTVILLFVIALGVWMIHLGDMSTIPHYLSQIKKDVNELYVFLYEKSLRERNRDQHQAIEHKQFIHTLSSSIERLVGELNKPNGTLYRDNKLLEILQVLWDIEKSVNRIR